ncbi:signal peptidase II [Actinomyces sp.]|uniref:signal peptidase II n=1 Tax=Actinomyces sp. TaxID=29317 RepID=UPI0034C6BB30
MSTTSPQPTDSITDLGPDQAAGTDKETAMTSVWRVQGEPSQTAGGLRRPGRAVVVLWLLAVAVVLLDQLTKVWATRALADGERVALLGDWLGLVLVRNPGAAFSLASGQTWILTAVAIVVTVVVLRISRRLASIWWSLALGLVLGGAVGNLIDRLVRAPGVFRGHVVDFIDYAGFFVGNVADIAIVGAAGLIVVLSLLGIEIDGTRVGEASDHGESAAVQTLGRQARRRGGARGRRLAAVTTAPTGEADDDPAAGSAKPVEPVEPEVPVAPEAPAGVGLAGDRVESQAPRRLSWDLEVGESEQRADPADTGSTWADGAELRALRSQGLRAAASEPAADGPDAAVPATEPQSEDKA